MRVGSTSIYLFFALLFLMACVPVKKAPTTFDMSKLSLSNSEIRVSASQVAAGNSVVVSLRLKNKDGGGYSTTKPIVSFYVVDGTSTGVMSDATTNGGGIYTASFTGVNPGTAKRIHARIDGKEVTSFNPTIQVTIGGFSLSNSTISLSSSSVTSGDSITATLTVRDASNFQLSDGGLSVDFYHSGGVSTGTFGGVNDNLDGTYSVTFTGLLAGSATNIYANIGGATVSSSSPTVAVNHGTISSLVFIQQPGNTTTDASISPSITVAAQDLNGNIVTDYSSNIVLSIDGASNPSGATLAGTLTQLPVDGIASFSDVSINYYGIGYRLLATSGSYTVLSNAFNIVPISLSYDWPFTALTTAQYTSSNWTSMEFNGGAVRLVPSVQTDTASAIGTMDAGTASGVVIGTLADGSSQGLKLGNSGSCNGMTTNCSELDASWTPQWSSLKGYWKMNNNWNDALGVNNGTPLNTNFLGQPKIGSHSGKFFGNGYVDVGTNASLDRPSVTGEVTISAWVKAPSTAGGVVVFQGFLNSPPWDGYGLAINGAGFPQFYSNGWATSTTAVNDGYWHHIAVTHSGGVYIFYIDSVVAGSGSLPVPGSHTGNRYLGGTTSLYTGEMDDVAVWEEDLTAAQIKIIFDRQSASIGAPYGGVFTSRVMDAKNSANWTTLSWITTLPFFKELPDYSSGAIQNETASDYSSLVGSTGAIGANDLMTGIEGLWHLDETSVGTAPGGKDFKDDSGKGNHGQIGGIVTLGKSGAFSNAVEMLPNVNYINFSTFNISSTAYTVSWWLYPYVCDNFKQAMNSVSSAFAFSATATCSIYVGPLDGTRMTPTDVPDGTIKINEWQHLTYTVTSGGVGSFYSNGVLIASKSGMTSPPAWGGFTTNDNSNTIYGKLDEFAIWSRALHPNEVKQLYQRGASRIKYQVRSCATDPCTTESWKGPDGTSGTYFSELNNNSIPSSGAGDVKAGLPVMDWTTVSAKFPSVNTLTGQYFQYRTIFESDSPIVVLGPELKSTKIDPVHYDSSSPSIYGNNGVSFTDFNTFFPALGAGGCSDGLTYNLSLDKINWKYWNGVMWDDALSQAQSNSAGIIQSNSAKFSIDVGRGTLYVKTYLNSTGETSCSLDNIHFGGNK